MIAAILSADAAWGIGKDGDLLVSIPEDLKRFSKLTRKAAVIMGRKTWESLPKKPLPKRENIIISRQYSKLQELGENVWGAGLEEITAWLEDMEREAREEPVFVIGGGQIYEALLPYCSRVYVTRIDRTFDADTFFPDLDARDDWEITEESEEQVFVKRSEDSGNRTETSGGVPEENGGVTEKSDGVTEGSGSVTEETIRYRYVTYSRKTTESDKESARDEAVAGAEEAGADTVRAESEAEETGAEDERAGAEAEKTYAGTGGAGTEAEKSIARSGKTESEADKEKTGSDKENMTAAGETAETDKENNKTRRKRMNYTNVIEEIDPLYYTECEHKGKVERIDYKSSFMGRPMDKYAFVYTPYDYDPEKAYEILYLIHGGAEYAEKYLYENGEENKLKRAVDHMIDKGEIPPVIIVTPSEYPDNKIPETHEGNNGITTEFHKELVNDLLPVVEEKYKTFNSREHRGVMGWSMGSMTTWSVFMNRIDTFSRFGFLSAHAPAISGGPGGLSAHYTREWANDTCKAIAAAIDAQNVKKSDYSIYAITGSEDIVFEPFNMQMGVLQSYTDYFDFYGENQNACFLVWKDGEHHTQWRLQYTINAIKQFYR